MNDASLNPNEAKLPPTAVASIKGSQLHADTPSGAAWLQKYQHPPCSTSPEYCGIPDYNNTPSVHPEYKTIGQISTFKDGATATYFNKIILLYTSSALAPVFYYRVSTAGAFEGIQSIINSNINPVDWVAHNNSGRISYKSTTVSLNATDFSNQGVVTTAQFRPNKRLTDIGNITMSLFRRFGVERAVNFIRQRCGDIPTRQSKESDVEYLERAGADSWNTVALIIAPGTIPDTSTAVAMLSPNSVSAVAKDGCFVVQKFSQPFPQFVDFDIASSPEIATPVVIKACPCYIEITDSTGLLLALEPIGVVGQPGNAGTQLLDVAWFDMTWGVSVFEGLSVGPSGAGPSVVPPYLTVKCITGVELQPLIGSELIPFVKNSAVVDETALRIGSMISHSRLDALPAAANFWGSIGKVLLSAAPTIISTLTSLFGKKQSSESRAITDQTVKSLTAKIDSMQSKLSKPKNPRHTPQKNIPPPQPRKQQKKAQKPRRNFVAPTNKMVVKRRHNIEELD